MAASKIVISIISLLLVVGCVLGVVLLIVNSEKSEENISTSTKTAESICKPTEYKEACNKAVAEVAKNSSATHEDYILATIRATADELQKSLDKAKAHKEDLGDDKKESHGDMETCEKMIGYASDELQQVLKVVSETEAVSLAEQIDPILVWLTAIRSYQSTCVEEIRDEKLKKDMQQGLETSNELTFNAQKIVYNVLDILKDIGVDMGDLNISLPPTGQRRLLYELDEMNNYGFPSWVPSVDRKLLGAKKGGGGGKKGGGKAKGQGLFTTPPPPPLPPNPVPNAIVALDGSGKFKSIKQALAAYPANHQGRYIIHIKAGTYNEGQIIVDKKQNNVYMYGDGRDKTIITGSLNFAIAKIGTSQTATVVALGERFMAKGIGFRNTIGPAGHQAVAFRSQSPHTVMMDCSFEGYQDTLYYHAHEQFYKNCLISGTVDFIFGSGRAYIQDSDILVRKPEQNQANMVTADGRMKMEETGGVVLHNCKIMAAPELAPVKAQFPTYLGRPWKPAATSVIMMCDIGDLIKPEGWTTWESPEGKNNHLTCMFREYGNRGPGANMAGRVKWSGFKPITNEKDALGFTAGTFMLGGTWLPQSGVPARLGL